MAERTRSHPALASVSARPASRIDVPAAAIMVLLCAIWGVQQSASKLALSEGMPPVLQALLRSLIAAVLLLVWFAARRGRAGLRRLLALDDGTLGAGSVTAVLFALEFILLFNGIARSTAARSVVILYTAAFFTAVGAHLAIPGERLRPINAAGLLVAFGGVVAVIGGGGGSPLGDLLVLGGAAAWGSTSVVIKRSRALMAAPAEKVLAYQVIGSAPLLALACAFGGELRVPDATAAAWLSVLFQGVVVTFASYLTWFWLIGRYPVSRLAAFSFLTPLFGVAAAAVFMGDPVTPMLLVGLTCVGVGLRLVNR